MYLQANNLQKQEWAFSSSGLASYSGLDIVYFKNILFIYLWLLWIFIAACGLSLVAASGGYSLLWCTGFSLCWLLLLWSPGSRHMNSVLVAHGLESSVSVVVVVHHMWDLPGPEIEPVPPALAGGFLTTGPLGILCTFFFFNFILFLNFTKLY